MKVIVVGAGIIGANVAYRFAAAGHDVEVIEAGTPGGGTSSGSFAWLNANNRQTLEYHLLSTTAMADYDALEAEIGVGEWIHRCGNLQIARDAEGYGKIESRVNRLQAWGYPARMLSLDEVFEAEPALRTDLAIAGGAFYPTEGYLDAVPMIGSLLGRAADHGATVTTGAIVAEFIANGDTVGGVVLEDGSRVEADETVLCAGTATASILSTLGLSYPMSAKKGGQAILGSSAVSVETMIHMPGLSIRPDGAGRMMLHAENLDEYVDEATGTFAESAQQTLIERTAAVLNDAFVPPAVEKVTVAYRPVPGDGLPTIGRIGERRGLYLICTHSGVTLGALLAKCASIEVGGSGEAPGLSTFRPDRFFAPAMV